MALTPTLPSGKNSGPMGPADEAITVDISSADHDFDPPLKGLRVGTGSGGTLKYDTALSTGVTESNVQDGERFDVRITKVYKTGTTVSNMTGYR